MTVGDHVPLREGWVYLRWEMHPAPATEMVGAADVTLRRLQDDVVVEFQHPAPAFRADVHRMAQAMIDDYEGTS